MKIKKGKIYKAKGYKVEWELMDSYKDVNGVEIVRLWRTKITGNMRNDNKTIDKEVFKSRYVEVN